MASVDRQLWSNADETTLLIASGFDVDGRNSLSSVLRGSMKSAKKQMKDALGLDDTDKSPVINRPPKPPGPTLGPCFQFLTTDLDRMQWLGSVLIFRHVSFDRPEVEFICEANVEHDWEVLYENIFGMRIYRINLSVELRSGSGDEKVSWHVNWLDHVTQGSFYIARHDQPWRGGGFSCNGYDASIPKEVASGLNYDEVWNHLLSIHAQTPLHLLIWGGDQSYNDFVLEDVPFLKHWTNEPWEQRWTTELPEQVRLEVEEYYFNTYVEHWECRPEMKQALSSIPGVMMWDDHDIFDGARSYPPLLNESPVMRGLFDIAQKMRLLFQHHTTVDKARQHGLFGHEGYNYVARCGPSLAILGADQRTERDTNTIQHDRTWDLIFEKLNNELTGVKHLIAVFPVPFSYVRFHVAEMIFGFMTRCSKLYNWFPWLKATNSIFGLPELYDDLYDEWTHRKHLAERNRVLLRFQQLSQTTYIRTTFFSGDVHCCGISRFRSNSECAISPLHDHKLMYQIISSAIVNKPPPKILIRALHLFAKVWYPLQGTEESLVDFFDHVPESGGKQYLRKLLPNRNWCYFEQSNKTSSTFVQTRPRLGLWQRLLNWIRGITEVRRATGQDAQANNLNIRLWLECNVKNDARNTFADYDLLIPYLK